MIKIKEHLKYTTYLFSNPMYIDQDYNVTTDTRDYDSFVELLNKHSIKQFKTTRTVDERNNHAITLAVHIDAQYHTEQFNYDVLTLLMTAKQ